MDLFLLKFYYLSGFVFAQLCNIDEDDNLADDFKLLTHFHIKLFKCYADQTFCPISKTCQSLSLSLT